jgi:hypothetical protein
MSGIELWLLIWAWSMACYLAGLFNGARIERRSAHSNGMRESGGNND